MEISSSDRSQLRSDRKLPPAADLPTLRHWHRVSIRRWPEQKRRPDPGRRRWATASRVLSMLAHQSPRVTSIKKMSTSIGRSAASAGAV